MGLRAAGIPHHAGGVRAAMEYLTGNAVGGNVQEMRARQGMHA
jgi:hypothetical protein